MVKARVNLMAPYSDYWYGVSFRVLPGDLHTQVVWSMGSKRLAPAAPAGHASMEGAVALEVVLLRFNRPDGLKSL